MKNKLKRILNVLKDNRDYAFETFYRVEIIVFFGVLLYSPAASKVIGLALIVLMQLHEIGSNVRSKREIENLRWKLKESKAHLRRVVEGATNLIAIQRIEDRNLNSSVEDAKQVDTLKGEAQDYLKLFQKFTPRPLKSEQDLEEIQGAIDTLIDKDKILTQDEKDYLDILGTLVLMYETQQGLRPDHL